MIFKMAAVRHLGFKKFAVFFHVALVDMPFCFLIQWRLPPSWILKISIFGHVTVFRLNICYSVPIFIKIGRFFTEIWRFNDFQNGGRPPYWILKICRFCHLTLVDMPFCFLTQHFAEIGQSVDELWPKKRFSRWRPPPSWISKIQFLVTWL